MIDLHCHMIPGIDDGATDMAVSLEMARIAVDDGITTTACTSHMFPGMFNNSAERILQGMGELQAAVADAGLALNFVQGADIQLQPGMVEGVRSGSLLSLNKTRYFLFEPPHVTAPPTIDRVVKQCCDAGLVPIITHPERLKWIEYDYSIMQRFVEMGAWLQLTAGSITGTFGPRVQYWSERMLDEGLVHIVSTDAHNTRRRAPVLSKARDAVAARLGAEEAGQMVLTRPQMVLDDADPVDVPPALFFSIARDAAPLQDRRGSGGQKQVKEERRKSFWPFGRKAG
jgi:protein-tyrosine phosphatase